MSFVYLNYLPILIIGFCIFAIFSVRHNRKFLAWVKDYWFFKAKLNLKISFILKLLGILFILLSLLDLRGKAEKVKSKVRDQKTIILIDSSASMLAEDVRPNRFKKALLMARHFVKNAFGHQVSVLVFSDTHKRLLPFTDDIDLLDSRIAALEDLDLREGGSNLTQAIHESLSYFVKTSWDISKIKGNLLVFTDSEENGEEVRIEKNLEGINLAIVAVGTRKGAPIPLRGTNGRFIGNKKFQGKDVITKLDEKKLKSFSNIFEYYKYWVALSYSMPTQEILDFFRNKTRAQAAERDHVSRPVKAQLLVIPGVLLLLLSYILKMGRIFKSGLALLLCFNLFAIEEPLSPEDQKEKDREKFREENRETFNKLREGFLDKTDTFKLGEKALRKKLYEEAELLYKGTDLDEEDIVARFNQATASLAKGNIGQGIRKYENLKKDLEGKSEYKELTEKMRSNTYLAVQQQIQKQKQEQKKKQQKQQQSGDGKGQKQSENKNEGKQENKENKQESQGKEQEKEQTGDTESQKEREERIKQQKKMVKIPNLLKQLMDEDRSLQKKNIDPRTGVSKRERKGRNEKNIPYSKKDW